MLAMHDTLHQRPLERASRARADQSAPPVLPTPSIGLEAVWARHADEVRAAQRLRWRVFADELGARLSPPPGTPPGLDADAFDGHCEHLLVRTVATADTPSQVVGTYRVLTPAAARMVGRLYTETEFELTALAAARPRLLELGRSCVDPAFRQGGVIMMLWASLAAFMRDNGLDAAIGCASLPMHDGGHAAASLWHRLCTAHLAPEALQVRPRLPLPLAELRSDLAVEPPPLVKGYLRCGAMMLGAPAWDPEFNVADLPMMLQLADLPAVYRRRFLDA
jgi:putative hemolysin